MLIDRKDGTITTKDTGFFHEKNSAREYLNFYYGEIGPENNELVRFFSSVYRNIEGPNQQLLEFSGGGALYSLISAADRDNISNICYSDYSNENLEQVRLWKESSPEAFDWSEYIRRSIYHERKRKGERVTTDEISDQDVARRAELMRAKISLRLPCNARLEDPIGPAYREAFDIVNVNFVPESITGSKDEWKKIMANVASLVKPGGYMIMTALEGAEYYKLGKKKLPATYITEHDLEDIFPQLGFPVGNTFMYGISSEDFNKMHGRTSEGNRRFHGFSGVLFVRARKEPNN